MPPFLGLLLTSAGFIVPAVVARRRKKRYTSAACNGLAATSLMFHSCYGPVVTAIDTVYAHIFAIYFSLYAIGKAKQSDSLRKRFLPSIIAIPLSIYFMGVKRTHGRISQLWHMAFHIASQACIVAHCMLF